jgi:hypothetical protein
MEFAEENVNETSVDVRRVFVPLKEKPCEKLD